MPLESAAHRHPGASVTDSGGTRRAYIVTAHPDPQSLTLRIAERLAAEVVADGGYATVRNLFADGFAPQYRPEDLAGFRGFVETHTIAPPASAVPEQDLLDGMTDLVVVFPVFWWSMPAQLKGWLDQILTGGWAWGATRLGRDRTQVAHLTAHVVALTGSSAQAFAAAGYDTAMRVQIEQGIFRYCGFGDTTWSWVWDPSRADAAALEADIEAAVARVTRR